MNTALIDKIIALARADDDIRAVILEGSWAVHRWVDDLSDYDVNLHTCAATRYLSDDRRMSQSCFLFGQPEAAEEQGGR